VDALAFGFLLAAENDALGQLAEIEGFPALDTPLAGREREQRVDQPLLLGAELQRLLAGGSQGVRVGVWVGPSEEIIEGSAELGQLVVGASRLRISQPAIARPRNLR
jgi:hypothetical protein